MGQQASAMSQMAQAQLDNSKSLERLAEASHMQVSSWEQESFLSFVKIHVIWLLMLEYFLRLSLSIL